MKNIPPRYYAHITALCIFFIMMVVFRTIILDTTISSDFNAHIRFAKEAFEGTGYWPRHFLYFLLISITSIGAETTSVWEMSGWIWLALLIVAKFYAILWFFAHQNTSNGFSFEHAKRSQFNNQNKIITICIATALLFVFCFPQLKAYNLELWYSYSFPPNTWHNSTQITLMPIAIFLFGLSAYQLKQQQASVKRSLLIGALAVLSAFAKPSYLMVWAPAFGIIIAHQLLRDLNFKKFGINSLPLIFGLIVIIIQYFLIYSLNINQTSIEFGYMEAWLSKTGRLSSHFYISIIFSSLFPIVYYILNFRSLARPEHQLAIYGAVIGYLFAMLVSESGDRMSGNYMWPIIPANFVLYMVCIFDLNELLKIQKPKTYNIKLIAPALLFLMSTIWGVLYLVRYLQTGGYG